MHSPEVKTFSAGTSDELHILELKKEIENVFLPCVAQEIAANGSIHSLTSGRSVCTSSPTDEDSEHRLEASLILPPSSLGGLGDVFLQRSEERKSEENENPLFKRSEKALIAPCEAPLPLGAKEETTGADRSSSGATPQRPVSKSFPLRMPSPVGSGEAPHSTPSGFPHYGELARYLSCAENVSMGAPSSASNYMGLPRGGSTDSPWWPSELRKPGASRWNAIPVGSLNLEGVSQWKRESRGNTGASYISSPASCGMSLTECYDAKSFTPVSGASRGEYPFRTREVNSGVRLRDGWNGSSSTYTDPHAPEYLQNYSRTNPEQPGYPYMSTSTPSFSCVTPVTAMEAIFPSSETNQERWYKGLPLLDVGYVPERIEVIETLNELNDLCCMLLNEKMNPTIALDLEGRDLGRHGSLCIITLATVECVYLIDIVALGAAALEDRPYTSQSLLKKVLESPFITKLMFDCRGDCEALFFNYNVRLHNVLDLQVACCCAIFNTSKHLPSMKTAFTRLGLLKEMEKEIKDSGRRFFDPKAGGSLDAWEYRPLHPLLMEYCAVDVKHFFSAYQSLEYYADFAIQVSEERMNRVCNGEVSRNMSKRDFDVIR